MVKNEFDELFNRYEGNPIFTPENWPYRVASVFNPGATKFNEGVLLLARVEDRQGYSHLTKATSKDGKTNWQIDSQPTLEADLKFGEAEFGLEDPRIVWIEELKKYIITCVSFAIGVAGEPANISLISTKNFSTFRRLARPLIPPNKDASLFSRKVRGPFGGRYYAIIHRPNVERRADIWVSYSKNLRDWGRDRVLIPTRHRRWDEQRVGLGSQPIETPEGWLILYHGARDTASGTLYRVGLALLDLETLELIRRSKEWVFSPRELYERVGNVDDIVFPGGAVVEGDELLVYYGAADSVVSLAIANLNDVLAYLKTCPES